MTKRKIDPSEYLAFKQRIISDIVKHRVFKEQVHQMCLRNSDSVQDLVALFDEHIRQNSSLELKLMEHMIHEIEEEIEMRAAAARSQAAIQAKHARNIATFCNLLEKVDSLKLCNAFLEEFFV